MAIICLFGPDGSGKSSISEALRQRLRSEGRVKVSWMRGTHTAASVVARFLRHFSNMRGTDNPYYDIAIPGKLRPVWHLLEFLSVIPVLLVRFLLPSLMGYTVIAERYIPDFIVWVSLTSNDPGFMRSFAARFLLALVARAGSRFYITADHSELVRRRSDSSPSFLAAQLQLYRELADRVHAKTIDTTDRLVSDSIELILAAMRNQ